MANGDSDYQSDVNYASDSYMTILLGALVLASGDSDYQSDVNYA